MTFRIVPSILGKRTLRDIYTAPQHFPTLFSAPRIASVLPIRHTYATVTEPSQPRDSGPPPGFRTPNGSAQRTTESSPISKRSSGSSSPSTPAPKKPSIDGSTKSDSTSLSPSDWDENPDLSISSFSELPTKNFGVNQHIIINEEFKEALRQILWKFKAPIRYAFAYGSGVFPQNTSSSSSIPTSSVHPSAPEAISKVQMSGPKMIDFIFGVSYSQHWHSLNLQEHRDHYSAYASLGSYAVSKLQDSVGAGAYFLPYVTINGTLIKYGVVNLDTLCRDLSEWDTLYLAGRLQKPVKILRDHPSVRLANQVNLISAVRTALLLLPPEFTEQELYATIAGISYMGDPRMSLPGEDPRKVHNIVHGQQVNFRRLYAPLIENLPNISFNDSRCSSKTWYDDDTLDAKMVQDMDPIKRGNMVRRLPKSFREKLYFEYQSKFSIPRGEFNKMLEESSDKDSTVIKRREGGPFEQRIAKDTDGIKTEVRQVITKTIRWPSITQSLKAIVTSGFRRSWRYTREKREKYRASEARRAEETAEAARSKTQNEEGTHKKGE